MTKLIEYTDSIGPATERAKVMWRAVTRAIYEMQRERGGEVKQPHFCCDLCGWSQPWPEGMSWDAGEVELAKAGWRMRPWPLTDLYVSLCPDCADLCNVLAYCFARGAETRGGAPVSAAHGKWQEAMRAQYGDGESDGEDE